MSTKFCTVNDVKPYLNMPNDYVADDFIIGSQIEQATALIREYTRREWTKQVHTQYFSTEDIDIAIQRGRGYAKFQLREKPVDVSGALYPKVRYSPSGKWDEAADLETTVYDVDTRLSQIIIYPAVMTSSGRSLRVVYTAGYEISGDDPEVVLVASNLKSACAIQAAFRVRGILDETSDVKQKQDRRGLSNYAKSSSGLVGDALALIKSETRLFMGSNG